MTKSRVRYIVTIGIALLVSGVALAAGPNVTTQVLPEMDAAHAGTVYRLAVRVQLGGDWHVNAHRPLDEFLIPTELALTPPTGFEVKEVVYPEPVTITLEGTGESLAVYGETFVLGVAISVGEGVAPGEHVIPGTLKYQACDNKQCLPPASVDVEIRVKVVAVSHALTPQNADVIEPLRFGASPAGTAESPRAAGPTQTKMGIEWQELMPSFTIVGQASGYLKPGEFLAFLDDIESGRAPGAANPLADKSFWLVVLTVVIGGLLLNLTPCVLPLIPVNIAIIGAGAKAGSRVRGFLLGGAYGTGIALAYGALGLVVVLGVSQTFGALNATFWFNAIIAVVFVLLALAMFDVFLIDFTRFQASIGLRKKAGGSFVIAFLMGMVSALLAGACVAPVIISTLLYAQSRYADGVSAALFLPFLLGVGMALPWPLAGAGLSFLPKPGIWMERVKYAFGIVIIGFAVYYGYLAVSLFSNRYLVDRESVRASVEELDAEGWRASLDDGLREAQKSGKPVIVDFWATWCKNCLAMNKTTFKDPQVVARLAKYEKVKLQAEDPSDPATKELMERFGVLGLPTYVVLRPGM